MIREPHFVTRTDNASKFRGKMISVLPAVLVAVLAVVVVSRSLDLPAHASTAYARFVGGDQPPPHLASSSEPIAKSMTPPDHKQNKGSAMSKQIAGGSRGEVGDS